MAIRSLAVTALALLVGCGEPLSETEREVFKTFSCPVGYIKVFAPPYLDCLPKE